jgi:hypothetical protein
VTVVIVKKAIHMAAVTGMVMNKSYRDSKKIEFK